MSTSNIYHLRRVAPASAKPCFICYKSTASCLITPDNRDFFFVCDGHLKDTGFASPIVDKEEEEAKKKKEAMASAIEEVKKEYEEKQKKKKEKKDKKDEDKKDSKKEDQKDEKDCDEKIKAIEGTTTGETKADEPRVFALHKSILQMRIAKAQQAQRAKRQAEAAKNPIALPAVPKDLP